jgi:nitroreductase
MLDVAATLPFTVDEVLTTTRSVRRRLDLTREVDLEVVSACLSIALQAPNGSNLQPWHFVVVTDTARKQALGDLYRDAYAEYREMPFAAHQFAATDAAARAVADSGDHLAAHLQDVPLLLVPCVPIRLDDQPPFMTASVLGSVAPAIWSFCLAARARGLGTCWTTLLLLREAEAAEILGIPYDQVSQVALIPVAHTIGTRFRTGRRRPLAEVLHVDIW